jgi:hypothetical protein
MKRHILKYAAACNLMSFILLSSIAQAQSVNWQNKISIGGNTTNIHCNINLKESGELYLQADTLQLTGNFTGETGSKVFLSVNTDRHGFMNVSGTANGVTEIIPDFSNDWDGSRIELVKVQHENPVFNAFQMQDIETDGFLVQLKNEIRNNALIWYIEKTGINPCLPLIVQLGNHTLLANNNAATNGGYKFVYYYWHKNGQHIKEGAHSGNGGSYYTGGADLDATAEYTVGKFN